jgi:hypothetical protein
MCHDSCVALSAVSAVGALLLYQRSRQLLVRLLLCLRDSAVARPSVAMSTGLCSCSSVVLSTALQLFVRLLFCLREFALALLRLLGFTFGYS